MYDHSRLTRLITLALAACAVTWALAGTALARPDASPQSGGTSATPAYKAVAGDTNKAPGASAAPAYQPAVGDTLKTPDRSQVQRVLSGIGRGKTPGQPVVTGTNDDTGTVALVVAIVAMLTALGAVTLIVTRTPRPMLRA
jgi:hypothetical protein